MSMTPRRPYILRALYDWLLDNGLTPHLVVDADFPGTEIPRQFVQDGQIVLNVAPSAVHALRFENTEVVFRARFAGQDQQVFLPMGSLLAIYARENGAGTIFEPEQGLLRDNLISEVGSQESEHASDVAETEKAVPHGKSVDEAASESDGAKKSPHLTLVK